MVKATDNGKCLDWFKHPKQLTAGPAKDAHLIMSRENNKELENTPALNQLKILLKRGFIKSKRDSVNITKKITITILFNTIYIFRL